MMLGPAQEARGEPAVEAVAEGKHHAASSAEALAARMARPIISGMRGVALQAAAGRPPRRQPVAKKIAEAKIIRPYPSCRSERFLRGSWLD